MSFDVSTRPSRRRTISPVAATALALVAGAAGVVAWLAFSGPPPRRDDPSAGVSVALTAPAATPQSAAESPASETARPEPQAAAPAPPKEPTAPAMPENAAAPAAVEKPAEATALSAPSRPAPAPAPTSAAPETAAASVKPSPPPPAEAAKTAALPPPAEGMAPAPDPDLIEASRFGRLPRVAPDGRKTWQAYAKPFDANDQRPRLAIIVGGLGMSSAATEAAIQSLPAGVTLSFSPYARGLAQWVALARAAGHEVLLDLPMEPINFPANDPGPETLLTSLTAEQNRTRLRTLLGRASGYVGVVNHMGSRFTTSEPHLRPILSELRDRGLLFVDSRSTLRSVAGRTASELKLPRVINSRFVDAEASRDAIDARLAEVERIARVTGYAVGMGQPFPVTIDRIGRWARDLEDKGVALAPVSALVNMQSD